MRNIQKALSVLKKGECIVVPTDTVYGLLCPFTQEGLKKIQKLKQRDMRKPVAVYVGRKKEISKIAKIKNAIEKKIITKLMPGRITLILEKNMHIDYPWKKIGIRIPKDPSIIKLLRKIRAPLYASSANISGKEMTESEIMEYFKNKVKFIEKGTTIPLASTVLEVKQNTIEIKREGVVSIWKIMEKTKEKACYSQGIYPSILIVCTGNTCRSPMAYGFFKYFLPQNIKIITAGTKAVEGIPASTHTIKVMQEKGINIAHHRSQKLKSNHIVNASLILAMERKHYFFIIKKWPWAKEKTYLFNGFPYSYPKGKNISDPIGKSINFYRRVRNIIERRCKEIADIILSTIPK